MLLGQTNAKRVNVVLPVTATEEAQLLSPDC